MKINKNRGNLNILTCTKSRQTIYEFRTMNHQPTILHNNNFLTNQLPTNSTHILKQGNKRVHKFCWRNINKSSNTKLYCWEYHTANPPIWQEKEDDVECNQEHRWDLFCTSRLILQEHHLQWSCHYERQPDWWQF